MIFFTTYEEKINEMFQRIGRSVQLNPNSDGNCQFNAIANQLQGINLSHSAGSELRESIVNYMIEFRISPFNERPDFSEFFDEQIYSSYEEYLDMMSLDSTFGDHLTLQAASEFFCSNTRGIGRRIRS